MNLTNAAFTLISSSDPASPPRTCPTSQGAANSGMTAPFSKYGHIPVQLPTPNKTPLQAAATFSGTPSMTFNTGTAAQPPPRPKKPEPAGLFVEAEVFGDAIVKEPEGKDAENCSAEARDEPNPDPHA